MIAQHVGALLDGQAARRPAAEAVVFQGHRLTYAALHARVERLAAALRDLGLERGERLALLIDNSHHAYEIILAAARAGIPWVPLNPMLKPRELTAIVTHAGASAIVAGARHVEAVAPLLSSWPSVRSAIALDAAPPGGWHAYEAIVEGAGARPSRGLPPLGPDDLFALLYTSGTTGLPKGTMLTHGNVLRHVELVHRYYGIHERTRGLVVLPYFVGAALNVIHLPTLARGGAVVFQERFTPERFFACVATERITHVQTVPTILIRLLESPAKEAADLSSLEIVGYGSAPMPVDRLRQALDLFGPRLLQIYGLTETCAMATCLRPEEHVRDGRPNEETLGTIGKPVDGIDLRIVDDEANPVPSGEAGEIALRGLTVTRGYWQMPEATAAAFRDGWFLTGDVGRMDARGYVTLTDRKKDVIITGGINVYPRDVEEVLYTHPDVLEAAVIGVPDPEWGESVLAVVVRRPGRTASEDELIAYCRERVAGYKKPKAVRFVDEIPRNPSGKVLKRLLRDRFPSLR